MSLALFLREGTAQKHAETEKVPYLVATFRGKLDPGTYTWQLESFHSIYSTMESELEKHKTHPILSQLYFPEIYRTQSIEADLEFYTQKKGTKKRGSITRATQEYVDYILHVSKTNPTMLVAQSYVRYLGDLSGGQVLRKIIAKTFELTSDEGLAFYDFPKLQDHGAFKEKYRGILNNLQISEAEKVQLLEEANTTFDLNKNLFLELESAIAL